MAKCTVWNRSCCFINLFCDETIQSLTEISSFDFFGAHFVSVATTTVVLIISNSVWVTMVFLYYVSIWLPTEGIPPLQLPLRLLFLLLLFCLIPVSALRSNFSDPLTSNHTKTTASRLFEEHAESSLCHSGLINKLSK